MTFQTEFSSSMQACYTLGDLGLLIRLTIAPEFYPIFIQFRTAVLKRRVA